jgi:hypothetical protein
MEGFTMSSAKRLVLAVAVAFAFVSAGCSNNGSRVTAATASSSTQPILTFDSSAKTQATAEPVGGAATPAAFNTPASMQPSHVPTQADIADVFDSQLQRLIANDASVDPSIASLPADEKQLITAVTDSLAAFRAGLRNGDGLMATRVSPLLALSDRIRAQTPLALPTLAICKSVTQFGVYDAIEPASFPVGKESATIVYCEVDNFTSRQQPDGKFETKLRYEAVLYSDHEHSAAVLGKKPASITDTCRNRRRDFFLADRLTLPASLPAGKYILKVTVVDELANHVAERTVPIMVAPN